MTYPDDIHFKFDIHVISFNIQRYPTSYPAIEDMAFRIEDMTFFIEDIQWITKDNQG